jgi:AGZA family xanthine/uracil permease-like MFS transporter
MLERLFKLQKAGTTVRTEIIAGTTTFMTLSYIIFVQPAVLATAGMDFGAVVVATCVASALATFLMGFLANYPIALAPAMGHNFFFAFMVCGAVTAGGLGYSWQTALGAVCIAGLLFVFLSKFGLREKILTVMPDSLKHAIAAGIGLLIALVGFEWGGIVVATPETLVGLGKFSNPPVLLTFFGLTVTAVLLALRVRGSILIGIILSAIAGLLFGLVQYRGFVSLPPSVAPTLFKLDVVTVLVNIFKPEYFLVVFIFFFLALFDTVGTLVGVGERAGFIKDGKLPRAQQALFADAVGTVVGAACGTSTITSYVESAAGVSEGGRTGLANMVTGLLMLAALFLYPLIQMIGGGYKIAEGVFLYPVIAPALIIVGSMMMQTVAQIPWTDPTESIPAFLTMITMPVAFSITEGISLGFISYALLKIVSGKGREVHWIIYLFAILFIVRYVLQRA